MSRVELIEQLAVELTKRPDPAATLQPMLPITYPLVRVATSYNFALQGYSNNASILNLTRLRDFIPYEPMASLLTLLTTHHGGTLIDIGANIGYFTLLAVANSKRRTTVHAFEPLTVNHMWLLENLKLNRLEDRVTAHSTALGDCSETRQISVYGTGSSLVRGWDGGQADKWGLQEVNVAPMDTVLSVERCRPPITVKIDVEGHELAVLRGGEQVLSSTAVGAVLIEVSHSLHPGGFNPEAVETLETLREFGYERYGLKASMPSSDNPRDCAFVEYTNVDPANVDDWPTNWFCVRAGHPFDEARKRVPLLFPTFISTHHRTERQISDFLKTLESR